jgi:hypothetical protein
MLVASLMTNVKLFLNMTALFWSPKQIRFPAQSTRPARQAAFTHELLLDTELFGLENLFVAQRRRPVRPHYMHSHYSERLGSE